MKGRRMKEVECRIKEAVLCIRSKPVTPQPKFQNKLIDSMRSGIQKPKYRYDGKCKMTLQAVILPWHYAKTTPLNVALVRQHLL
jgi:hypothetical protein